MSMESAKAYIERFKSDEDFRTKVAKCRNVQERTKIVRQEGYEFTQEEINTARKFSKC